MEPSVVDDIVVVKHLWMWGLGERRRGGGGEEGRERREGEEEGEEREEEKHPSIYTGRH